MWTWDPISRIVGLLTTGGWVVAVLMVVSVTMWTLILNRVLLFRQFSPGNMTHEVASQFVFDQVLPDKKEFQGMTTEFVQKYVVLATPDSQTNEAILDEVTMALVRSLDRYTALIGVLAAIAPLLGLLGTVLGMITTFEVISVFGTGNAQGMSRGISEALVTTEVGLLVAIPGLYMHHVLSRRGQKLKTQIASLGVYLKRYV